MYEYKAKVIRWLDGDTLEVSIDLGFYVHKEEKIRLARINAPELSDEVPYRMRKAKSARFQARKFLSRGCRDYPADDEGGTGPLRALYCGGDLQGREPVGLFGEDRGGEGLGRISLYNSPSSAKL